MQKIDLTKPVEAKPEALAVAKFLRSQDLKLRTCIFEGNRKDMFKGKHSSVSQLARLTRMQLNEPFALYVPTNTLKLEPKILSSHLSPTILRREMRFSLCP